MTVNAVVGWALAGLAFAAGWIGWGWRGLALAFSVVVFWLLLQFSRSLRVLRDAGGSPVGRVDSAVMLHSRLKPGMRLMQVLRLTRSLGTQLAESPETWGWSDDSGARVRLSMQGGKLHEWSLERAPPDSDQAEAAP